MSDIDNMKSRLGTENLLLKHIIRDIKVANLIRDDFLREKFSKSEFDSTKSALAVEY